MSMQTESQRLLTFAEIDLGPNTNYAYRLSRAGFYYQYGTIQCYFCNLSIGHDDFGDPQAYHHQNSPSCPMSLVNVETGQLPPASFSVTIQPVLPPLPPPNLVQPGVREGYNPSLLQLHQQQQNQDSKMEPVMSSESASSAQLY